MVGLWQGELMRFYIVDVFAEKKYQGNQLAVLIPTLKLDVHEMQRIANEIHFSETAFVVSDKKANGGYDVRIFTPDIEVPFAGHPTLGTAFIIHSILEQGQSGQVILNLQVGQIPVALSAENKELMMTQLQPTFGAVIQPEIIAEILNISVSDINTNFPIQVVSTGLPAVIIPMKTLRGVKNCAIHAEKYQRFISDTVKANLLVFTTEVEKPENNLHVRVFVDDVGFREDAATGSANGNLAGYLLKHNFFSTSILNLQVEQGYELGRNSLLKINAVKDNATYRICVGGKVVLIAQGEWI